MLYHGSRSPYPYSTEIWSCFEDPEKAKQWILGNFLLVDLTVQSDEAILSHGLAAAMEYFFKHQRARKPAVPWVEKLLISEEFHKIKRELGLEYILEILKYNLYSCGNETDSEKAEELLHLWKKHVPQSEEEIMTFAEQIEQKGIEKGIEKGEKQAQLKIAKKLMLDGANKENIQKYTGLSMEEIAQLFH